MYIDSSRIKRVRGRERGSLVDHTYKKEKRYTRFLYKLQ